MKSLRTAWADPLLRGTYSLLLNSGATAALGLAFWVLAARLQSSSTVGRDAVLIASMMTLSSIAQLNLANAVTRFIPRAGRRTGAWILRAYAVAVLATLVAAVAFLLIVPSLAHRLAFLRSDSTLELAFVLATALWTIFGLQDAVLTALRRAPWIPLENTIFGVLKLAFLPVLAAAALGHAIFISWAVPMVLLLLPVNYLIFVRFVPAQEAVGGDPPALSAVLPPGRGLRRFLAGDLIGSWFTQAAVALPPLLVVAILGSSANAYFYVPFALVTSFDTLFLNTLGSMVVEGAIATDALEAITRRVTRLFALLLVPGVVVLVAGAPLLLLAYGTHYGASGAGVLRLLALASVCRIVVSLYTAVARVQGRGERIAVVYGVQLVALMVLMGLLARPLGIDGAAIAWLGANALAAAVCAPSLLSTLKKARPARSRRAVIHEQVSA
jgi:O-antigen/teichoic acid export membrane protein